MNSRKAKEFRRQIEHAAQTQSDADALESIDLYPIWEAGLEITKENGIWYIDDVEIGADLRMAHEGRLYRVIQPHTTQEGWEPSINTASLYAEVALAPEGEDAQHPIVYSGNMELHEGKYYSQDGATYRCTRDSGVPLYNTLRDLVGLYVEDTK